MRRGGHPTSGHPVPSRHCHPPRPSSPPAPCPHPGPDHRHCHPPLPPTRAKPRPPRLVPPGLDLRPPHPCQELRKPPRHPPLPLFPTVTTMPMTSTLSKPRGIHRRRTTGRRLPSPRRRRPCHPGRGGGGAQNTAPCRSRDRAADQSDGGFLAVDIVVGGAGRGGSGGRGSGCDDNDMLFCCGMWS